MTMSDHEPTSFAARSAVAWIPTKLNTASAPRPPVRSRTASIEEGSDEERRVRPDLARERELVLADVERDDLGRRQGPEHLDREVAEAAHADDDRGRARDELGQRRLDRVVRREPGVGQGDILDRVEVAERDEVPRARDEHVLGHATRAPRSRATGSSARCIQQ